MTELDTFMAGMQSPRISEENDAVDHINAIIEQQPNRNLAIVLTEKGKGWQITILHFHKGLLWESEIQDPETLAYQLVAKLIEINNLEG